MDKFFEKFLSNSLTYAFTSLFIGVPIIVYYLIEEYPFSSVPILFIFFAIVAHGTTKEVIEEESKNSRERLQNLEHETSNKIANLQSEVSKSKKAEKSAGAHAKLWKQTMLEKSSGFPTLIEYIDYFEKLRDESISEYLETKKHPAKRASDMVKEESKRRREAEFQHKQIKALLEYYEKIAPFLLDFKDEIIDEKSEEDIREYTKEEREDKVTQYLTKQEYRKLSRSEKNQMALDRFWKRHKSKWLIGRLYERYVGYLFEQQGYDVEYVGIFKGYEDLGRDLICTKGKEVVVIQCKNWSKFKTLYEKHIFQFFGTVFEYRDKNRGKNVKAAFYATTKLSDLARRFAKELDIELVENHIFDQGYPSIKCNISRAGDSKIYHLPFDQQYDKTKIEPSKGEFYCKTIKEAESKGFRRAFRWRGKAEA